MTRDSASHPVSLTSSSVPAVTPRDADPEVVFLPPAKKRRISQEEGISNILVSSQSSKSRMAKDTTQPLKIRTNIVLNQPMLSSGHPQNQSSNLEIPRSPPLTPQKPPPKPIHNKVRPGSPLVLARPAPVCTPTLSNALEFLQNALVWFAKPRSESWGVRNLIPRQQRVHSVEAFLAGCGWCTESSGAHWVEKGVIFVDYHTVAAKDIARRALEMIDDRFRVLPLDQPRKRILIIDQKRWTLNDGMKMHVLYQFD